MMIALVYKDDVNPRTPQMLHNLKPPKSGTDNNKTVSRVYRRTRDFICHYDVACSHKRSDFLAL